MTHWSCAAMQGGGADDEFGTRGTYMLDEVDLYLVVLTTVIFVTTHCRYNHVKDMEFGFLYYLEIPNVCWETNFP